MVMPITTDFPATVGGYQGKLSHAYHWSGSRTLQELIDDNYELVSWDGKTPRPLIDSAGNVFGALAGRPNDEEWLRACEQLYEAMTLESSQKNFEVKYYTHRGDFPAINVGLTSGQGSKFPHNIRLDKHEGMMQRLLENRDLQYIADHHSWSLKLWLPGLYERFKEGLNALHGHPKFGIGLKRLTPAGVFPTAAFNFGPDVWTNPHCDVKNYGFGWCVIQPLGPFNPKAGAHLVLPDLKQVIEFPSGSMIMIPSATLSHANVRVAEGDQRASFTQYFPGGLLRFVDNKFRIEERLKKTTKGCEEIRGIKDEGWRERCVWEYLGRLDFARHSLVVTGPPQADSSTMGKQKNNKGVVSLPDAPTEIAADALLNIMPPHQVQEIAAAVLKEPSPSLKTEKKPEVKRMSTKMGVFSKEIMRRIQDAIIQLEGHASVDRPRSGHDPNNLAYPELLANYRCRECFVPEVLCAKCIAQAHINSPFHHIEKWNGSFFERASLSDLGFVIHLGHHGAPCPVNSRSPNQFVIVHTNGIHKCHISYCACNPLSNKGDHHIQLICHQLFAPTIDRPETAFTFAVLKHYHRHSLCSKVTLYDYCNALRKDTNAAFPEQVPDRYEEFSRVMRLWRPLKMQHQSGQFFEINKVLDHRRPGSMAVRCPACPEPGLNIEESEMVPEGKIHLYTLFISADGNFRLQRKHKNNDPDDFALIDGNAYFVKDDEFLDFVKDVEAYSDDSTCSRLKAVRQQNKLKFRNAAITGVIAIQCARHGVYLPQGIVDLEKGEAYARTDYALAHALSLTEGPRYQYIMLSYDIWCQYSVNLQSRFANNEKLAPYAPLIPNIRGAIPKMHISGHGVGCQINESFLYKPYSAMTCGEGIESAWAEQNFAAGSTKEQNAGHRHDTLDDYNGYWNWTKVHQLGTHLFAQSRKWSTLLSKRLKTFNQWTALLSPELIEEWCSMTTATHTKMELYMANTVVPTWDKTQSNLLEEAAHASKHGGTPVVEFISLGVQIEDMQENIKAKLQSQDLEVDRSVLTSMLHQWRADQHHLFPLLRPLPLIDDDCPENMALHLPSSYSEGQCAQLGILHAAEIERKIRHACAFDALTSLRNEIHRFNREKAKKKSQPRSQKKNTRSQKEFREIEDNKEVYQDIYMRMYRALKSLGDKDQTLKPLLKEEMWGKNMGGAHVTGDSSREDPWFWWVGKPDDVSEESWTVEWDRVHWMREKAAIERLEEEIELIKEEFRRVVTSFTKLAEVWTQLAKTPDKTPSGYRCYALRTAEMYRRLAKSCESNRVLAYGYQDSLGLSVIS
ncbi:hypothetical protein NP233_g4852 [Leucocoprinus birnbaumii]|uniref:CxC2-like cysteine cluster KDZ transposase-associated domain-containing protein n=1 Tax=Leucocoprinus birnbaumii TaxID=56174 RepID=A0AAD5YSF0_9AGAR|nr:hypothetical protein NP233_g4852 [Leucocoprinus birnbaumii]